MSVRDAISVTFAAEGEGPPLEVRFRRFLKHALRGYGLRNLGCVYTCDLYLAMASKLANASEVLGMAAERLEGKAAKAMAKRLREVKADVDLGKVVQKEHLKKD